MPPSEREVAQPIPREAVPEGVSVRLFECSNRRRRLPQSQCAHWDSSLREGAKLSQHVDPQLIRSRGEAVADVEAGLVIVQDEPPLVEVHVVRGVEALEL